MAGYNDFDFGVENADWTHSTKVRPIFFKFQETLSLIGTGVNFPQINDGCPG